MNEARLRAETEGLIEIKKYFTDFKIPKKQLETLITKILEYEDYDALLYDILGQLTTDGIDCVDKIISDLISDQVLWKSSAYLALRNKRSDKDHFIENPPEIKEGNIQCPKCKQKKIVIVEGQTRSCDEGFTYEMHCFSPGCGYKKRTNNF